MGTWSNRGGGPRPSHAPRHGERLLSREQVDDLIRRECARADRSGREFSLVLFRLTRSLVKGAGGGTGGAKGGGNRAGYAAARAAMRLARTMVRRARGIDDVGWFNDRFLCAVLPDTTPHGARVFADSVSEMMTRHGPKPLSVVYSYPGGWFASADGQAGQAKQDDAPHAALDRHGNGNGHSNGNGNGNGHHPRNGNGNGIDHGVNGLELTLVPAAAISEAYAGNGNGNGNGHGNGHSNGNGNGHSNGHGNGNGNGHSNGNGHGHVADALAAPRVEQRARLERGDLMPFFLDGLATGLEQPGLPAASVRDLLVRPLPVWKRVLDVLGAVVALMLFAPLLIVAALGIRVTSKGPVIFRQKRAGLGGRPFTIYKFRTMHVNAEAEQAALRTVNEQDGPAFKLKNDPRVFGWGKFLRKTSIDELPQLWNVLKGDMSLVGPRPLPVAESDACAAWQKRRLDVTPGLTCIWQIKGRSTVTFAEWVRMDVAYIRRRTPLHDLLILLKTVPAVLLRKGAK
jgi:lipopolysaccharide/colanic/teichoic acid biosynthesis glycosyltransferase